MDDLTKQVVSKFPEGVLEKYDFTNAVYTKALVRMTGVVCPLHGEFSQYSGQFRKGRGCPLCGKAERVDKRRSSADKVFSELAAIHSGKYSYEKSTFLRMNSKMTVTCKTHGDFEICVNHHYYRKQGCPACEALAKKSRIVKYRHLSAQAKINNTAQTFFQKCIESHGGKYSYPEQEYKGAKQKILVVCPEHGEFKQAAWAHLSGKGCQSCGAYTPKWEAEVSKFVESLGFSVTHERRMLDGMDVDIFIEEKGLGVELHGLHWHTERKRDKNNHRRKWQIAQEKGTRLIQVFEDEWVNNKDTVLNRIRVALGKSETYHARKTLLGVVPSADADAFFKEHHTQGSSRFTVCYGLRFNGQWVAMASFGKARTGAMVSGDSGVWEVLRFASKGRVRGGFSKLFKRFLRDYSPEKVVSYCDLRYGTGDLYEACGFELDGITEPDYWWVPPGKITRVPRYQTQKHKLATHPVLKEFYDPVKTEVEICHAAGWYRIYGVGHQRWVYTPKV